MWEDRCSAAVRRSLRPSSQNTRLERRYQVFYNPASPAEAMLEPLNFANAKLALILAIGFAGFGALAMLLLLQMSVA